MGKLYKNQSKLRITLDTEIDLSSCTCKIKYRKPSGVISEWNASISGTTLYYDLTSTSELNEAGVWQFWAHITFNDTRVAEGEPVSVQIFNSGT